ncbi:hypothetical protein [Primorskyibacter sp. S87]|uniref:hypothetical protein n=1 Tax=Primorskyibacter sp. S87 TaxID=3415126 RepID=UPI003C79E35B
MSDPVKSAQIEDVLSSIRRLVSEETRPEPAAEPQNTAPGRLVLTPALRVAEVDDTHLDTHDESSSGQEAAEAEVDAYAEDLSMSEFETADEAEDDSLDSVDEAIADDPHPLDFDPHVNPNTSEAPWKDPKATLFSAVRDETDELIWTERSTISEEASKPDLPEFRHFRARPRVGETETAHDTAVEQDVAARETSALNSDAPASEQVQEPHISQVPADVDAPEDTVDDATDPGAGYDEPVSSQLQEELPEAELPSDVAEQLTAAAHSDRLSSKIEALEAAIGQTEDQWEPDGEIGDDYAGTPVETIEWEDHHEDAATEEETQSEVTQEQPETFAEASIEEADQTGGFEDPGTGKSNPEQVAAYDQPDAETDDGDIYEEDRLDPLVSDEAILDEDSLRELVADIVREELQGALGERITRNVRKLVRREIHRAMTAQELD